MIIHDAAVTGSLSLNGVDLSSLQNNNLATTGSNTFVGNQTVTGSVNITGSLSINGISGIVGNLTSGYLPKSSTSTTLTNSTVYESGDFVGVGNRVTTNGSIGLIRNFNILGTDAVLRVARFTDSYSTLSPSVELINYSNDGLYRRFYWDFFVNGDDNFAIRQRLTGGGLTTNGTVIDQIRLMMFTGGNVGIGTTTDAGYKLDVNGTLRATGAATFSSSIAVGGAGLGLTGINMPNQNYLAWYESGGSGAQQVAIRGNGTALELSSGGGLTMTLDSSQRVGIGTTSPNTKLEMVDSGNAIMTVRQSLGAANGRYAQVVLSHGTTFFGVSDKTYQLVSNGLSSGEADFAVQYWNGSTYSERLRISSGGNVGIGTTSPSSSNWSRTLQLEGSSAGFKVASSSANGEFWAAGDVGINVNTAGKNLYLGNATNLTAFTLTSGGNVLIGTTTDAGYKLDVNGTGRFTDNLNIIKASNPQVNIVATSASGVPELYLFRGTSTVVGYLGAGVNTTVSGVGDFVALENRLSSGGIVLRTNGSIAFTIASTGAATFSSLGTGTVYSNGGTLTNTNPSDYNLKTNIQDLSYGLNEIIKLRPVSYLWKNDKINQGKQFGFIAQEVQEIMPDLVKDGEFLGLDKEAIFVTLVNAIKELNNRIIKLENK